MLDPVRRVQKARHHTGQRDAIRSIMRSESRPLTVQDIQHALWKQGWKWTSFHPRDSVKTSLKRAPDMITVGHNKWILSTQVYTQEQIESNLSRADLFRRFHSRPPGALNRPGR